MLPDDILALAEETLATARAKGLKIATAESCTGGLVAAALTAIAGSSDVFERGFVTYSNEAKVQLLGVSPDVLELHGAVSTETASAMVRGALDNSLADVAVSITGVAGPGGGSPSKPVGLVHFGAGRRLGQSIQVYAQEMRFGDIGRDGVRAESVRRVLRLLLDQIEPLAPSPQP